MTVELGETEPEHIVELDADLPESLLTRMLPHFAPADLPVFVKLQEPEPNPFIVHCSVIWADP